MVDVKEAELLVRDEAEFWLCVSRAMDSDERSAGAEVDESVGFEMEVGEEPCETGACEVLASAAPTEVW